MSEKYFIQIGVYCPARSIILQRKVEVEWMDKDYLEKKGLSVRSEEAVGGDYVLHVGVADATELWPSVMTVAGKGRAYKETLDEAINLLIEEGYGN